MGDVQSRHAEPSLDAGDLGAHLDAELRVEVGQRLVHQEHARLAHYRPAHRDALALAAGQLARGAVDPLGEAQQLGCLVDLLFDLGLGHPSKLQGKADVLGDCHVRVQGVVLEHHRYVTVLRRHVVDDAVSYAQRALGDVLEARHHAKSGRLAAARRPDEDHELALGDVKVELVDRLEAVRVYLGHLFEGDRRHQFSLSTRARAARRRPSCMHLSRQLVIWIPLTADCSAVFIMPQVWQCRKGPRLDRAEPVVMAGPAPSVSIGSSKGVTAWSINDLIQIASA